MFVLFFDDSNGTRKAIFAVLDVEDNLQLSTDHADVHPRMEI